MLLDATSSVDGLLLHQEPMCRIHRAQEPTVSNYHHSTLCQKRRHR